MVLVGILAAVLVVLVVLAVIGEGSARGEASRRARAAAAEALGTSASRVDAELGGGLVLPQLARGRLDAVELHAPHAEAGGVAADIRARLSGVATNGSSVRALSASARVPLASLAPMSAASGGPKVDRISGSGDELLAETSTRFLGLTVPVAVSLRPSASGGAVVLTPRSVRIAGTTVSADRLLSGPIGRVAGPYLKPIRVCLADRLPAGIDLRSAAVDGDRMTLRFDGRDVRLRDATKGRCA